MIDSKESSYFYGLIKAVNELETMNNKSYTHFGIPVVWEMLDIGKIYPVSIVFGSIKGADA